MKNKKLLLILPLLISLILTTNFSLAKIKYTTFTRKQFKIKIPKNWKKQIKTNYVKLYPKNNHYVYLKIKKITLSSKSKKYLKNQKTKQFAKLNKQTIIKQYKKLNPRYQYASVYKISKYKVIKLYYALDYGQLIAYYIASNDLYHQIINVCQKSNCPSYDKIINSTIKSFRSIKDKTPPEFSGAKSAASTSTSSITLTWNKATDKVSYSKNIKYLIYQANQLEGQNFSAPTYTTKAGVTSYQIDNLQESTSYYYVVRAKDETDNMDTNTTEAIATTKATSNNDPTAGSLQNVTYQSNGSTVVGRMYRPNGAGPFPVIIYNHGGVTPADPTASDTEINQLRQGDTYAVLATAYRGDFGSQGTLSVSIDDVNDVLAAIEYLKSKNYIDANKIGMWGKSRGGNVTLSAIERTTDSKASVTWFPYTNTTTFCTYLDNKFAGLCHYYLGFYGLTNPTYYARISSPVNFTSRLNTPLQNSHSTDDQTVPYSQSVELNAAMTGHSNYTFYEYTSGDHGAGTVWSDIALTRMYDFFASYLQ